MGYDISHLKIDLHVHSTASDGTLSASQLLQRAQTLGLGALAITDHDAIEGVREILHSGCPGDLGFVSGVEISSQPPQDFAHKGSLHILGYGFDPDNASLCEMLERLQAARKNRNPKIIERLSDIGFAISLSDVQEHAGEGQLGRPHIARTMVAKGIVPNVDAAFDLYLGKGKPAYVDKYRVPCRDAIQAIRNAGGIPVLAHPGLLQTATPQAIEALIVQLTGFGLGGVEVYYPSHSPEQMEHYAALATRHGLLMTGGSDFHGQLFANIELGSGSGNLHVPFEVYEKLMQAIEAQHANTRHEL